MSEVKKAAPFAEKNPKFQEVQDRLADAIKAVVSQQLATKDPPEVLETYERLQDEGFTADQALGLVGQVVSLEVAELIAGHGDINIERYTEALSLLPLPFTQPKIDWDKEESNLE